MVSVDVCVSVWRMVKRCVVECKCMGFEYWVRKEVGGGMEDKGGEGRSGERCVLRR